MMRGFGVPYRHGFLTERLRKYLTEDRKDMDVNKRSVYDFHVRESLKQALNDMIFILDRMDKKQFDKISDDLYEDIVRLLRFFSEKCYVDISESTYPFGRIKKYRNNISWKTAVYATYPRAMDILQKLSQDTLDKTYGAGRVYAYFMPRNEFLDLRECIEKLSRKIIFRKVTSEGKEENKPLG